MTEGGELTETSNARWERQRAMGRRAFVWRSGVIGWGLPIALLTVAFACIREQSYWSTTDASPRPRAGVVIAVALVPAPGHALGASQWDARERGREQRTSD